MWPPASFIRRSSRTGIAGESRLKPLIPAGEMTGRFDRRSPQAHLATPNEEGEREFEFALDLDR
jgi:hypothetical protein